MPIAGTKLNVLNMPVAAFKALDKTKKVIFRLFLNEQDEMTMAFWQGNDTNFDGDDPLNKLDVTGPSNFAWQKKMFFGDQKMGGNKVDRIQKKIKANPTAAFVIFIPTTDADLPEQIVYSINLNDTINPFDSQNLLQVGVTNPSPPRNSGRND